MLLLHALILCVAAYAALVKCYWMSLFEEADVLIPICYRYKKMLKCLHG